MGEGRMRYEENCKALEEAVKNKTVIRHISRHRNPDGSPDLEGNLKLWNAGMEPFAKMKLWERGTPGYDGRAPLQPEPYLVFVPVKKKECSTILIAHGGGFESRTGCEAVNAAYYFHKAGFNTAILCYRLSPYSRLDAVRDMQRGIRLLRSRAEELKTDDRIAAMGFSAGGMLSGNCGVHYDRGLTESDDVTERYSCRPDAVVNGYGAMTEVSFPLPFGIPRTGNMMGRTAEEKYYLATEKHVTPDTPPMFLWQTLSDDGRHGMCLAKALQDAGVPYELHIFQTGVHGLAMADGENDLNMNLPHIAHWGELCTEWLEENGFQRA